MPTSDRAQNKRVPTPPCPTKRTSPSCGPSRQASISATMRCCAASAVSYPRTLLEGSAKNLSATFSNTSGGRNPVALRSSSCICARTSSSTLRASARGSAVSRAFVSSLLITLCVFYRTPRRAARAETRVRPTEFSDQLRRSLSGSMRTCGWVRERTNPGIRNLIRKRVVALL